jgi:hypothetical protein
MAASPDSLPRRAADAQDVHQPPAAAPSEQDEPDEDEPEQREKRRPGSKQAEPDPQDEGWEPV